MKIIKKMLIGIFSVILYMLIICLIFSISFKQVLNDQLLTKIVSEEISSKTTEIFQDDLKDLDQQTLNSIKKEVENNEQINEIVTKYIDDTVCYLTDEDVNNIDFKEDLKTIINENKKILEDKFDVEIKEEDIDQIIETVDDDVNFNKYYNDNLQKTKSNLTEEQKFALKVYRILISKEFKLYVIIGIAVLTVLIALLQKSFYKWLKTLSIAFIVGSILSALISICFGTIVNVAIENLSTNVTINIIPLLNTTFMIFIIGIMLLIIYFIISYYKNKKVQ